MSEFAFRLRELSAAATPGPWRQGPRWDGDSHETDAELSWYCEADTPEANDVDVADELTLPDITLIVFLRNHAEKIAAVIEAAERLDLAEHNNAKGIVKFSHLEPRATCPKCQLRAALASLETET